MCAKWTTTTTTTNKQPAHKHGRKNKEMPESRSDTPDTEVVYRSWAPDPATKLSSLNKWTKWAFVLIVCGHLQKMDPIHGNLAPQRSTRLRAKLAIALYLPDRSCFCLECCRNRHDRQQSTSDFRIYKSNVAYLLWILCHIVCHTVLSLARHLSISSAYSFTLTE